MYDLCEHVALLGISWPFSCPSWKFLGLLASGKAGKLNAVTYQKQDGGKLMCVKLLDTEEGIIVFSDLSADSTKEFMNDFFPDSHINIVDLKRVAAK